MSKSLSPEALYRIERNAVVSCWADDSDYRHRNCRHDWNAAHPDDPVTEAEQAEFSKDIPWRQR